MLDSPLLFYGLPPEHDPKGVGAIIIEGQVVADTRQCCHCQAHFVIVKGSGKRRSYCESCDDITCGAEACIRECLPFEKRLEDYEAGKRAVL